MSENLNNAAEVKTIKNYYAEKREELFGWMSDTQRDSYHYLEHFLLNPTYFFGQIEPWWLGPMVEDAEWNNDDYRRSITHILASLEASIAYYATVDACTPNDLAALSEEANEIDQTLEVIIDYATELKCLIGLIAVEDYISEDCGAAENSLEASDALVDELSHKKMLVYQLEMIYAKRVSAADKELFVKD